MDNLPFNRQDAAPNGAAGIESEDGTKFAAKDEVRVILNNRVMTGVVTKASEDSLTIQKAYSVAEKKTNPFVDVSRIEYVL